MAEKPCIVHFGKGVSLTHPDNPMAGRFLTEEDMAGGRPVIDSPLPVRAKSLGPGEAEAKSGAVDPLARVTAGGTLARGDEIHTPLVRNPYAGTPDAVEYENGYEHAQQLGHQVLGQISRHDLDRWHRAAPAWRAGLVDGAKGLGIGKLSPILSTPGKTASYEGAPMDFPLTEYFEMKRADFSTGRALGAAGLGAGIGLGGVGLARHQMGMPVLPDSVSAGLESARGGISHGIDAASSGISSGYDALRNRFMPAPAPAPEAAVDPTWTDCGGVPCDAIPGMS